MPLMLLAKSRQKGFTIVELLIVIVVIAILAAITFVAFNSIQLRATEAALQSDLKKSATSLAAENSTKGSYPTSLESANDGRGLPKSSVTTYQYTHNASTNTFCLSATSDKVGANPYYVSSTDGFAQSGVCNGHTLPGEEITYEIADIGPAGGIIFYVDTNNTYPGFDYLEISPSDIAEWAQWGCNNVYVGTFQSALGRGGQNTALIVSRSCTTTDGSTPAAVLANDYSLNGFTDWYLPTMSELTQVYQNLGSPGLATFSNNMYWSSVSMTNNTTACNRQISGWGISSCTDAGRTASSSVRAVRAF